MNTVLVHGAPAGPGGLGAQVRSAAAGLAALGPVVALGPGRAGNGTADAADDALSAVEWLREPGLRPRGTAAALGRRLCPGRVQAIGDARLGRWAAGELDRLRPDRVYAFTQVALESLRWAAAAGSPSCLDNPNGHLRGFAEAYEGEARRLTGRRYRGHPSPAAVRRVEEEYALADRIRVSSDWAKRSMTDRGVDGDKIVVVPQPLDLARFAPAEKRPEPTGPLNVAFVGTLDLRKGFVPLLRTVRRLGPDRVRLRIVGATGDRTCRRLFEREAAGLPVEAAPGDPRPVLQRSELLVLPSLEDGFGFVVAEAMACGLPVVVTDACGAAALVTPGETGWVVPAGDPATLSDALADALREALAVRDRLPAMGRRARADLTAALARPGVNDLSACFPTAPAPAGGER
ncbi:glycosyltransferase family 4 protein [Alienimonas californiensis]|uniref:D-inositol 3-phosphate glycosyltransferase n=1 Tax=Alienimonas californiensis TaxID=2527989 RepID=A0A517P7Y2_9PLAN|nr:glycosyltransferase family 4 protein [Alienimonas californiensis]QDT15486.1 D-inositol 3-phosphate glycosyltransferase [Alienimonas californiensis]